jgi:predicted nucleic acid-binding Zn ribbon protein
MIERNRRNNKKEIKKLGDMLQNTMISVKRARNRNKSLREKWKIAAGEDISNHTEARMVKGGILFIEVDSATWLHRIAAFEKDELLASMQKEFKMGYISEIRLKVGAF